MLPCNLELCIHNFHNVCKPLKNIVLYTDMSFTPVLMAVGNHFASVTNNFHT
jgi:hypothetical protein